MKLLSEQERQQVDLILRSDLERYLDECHTLESPLYAFTGWKRPRSIQRFQVIIEMGGYRFSGKYELKIGFRVQQFNVEKNELVLRQETKNYASSIRSSLSLDDTILAKYLLANQDWFVEKFVQGVLFPPFEVDKSLFKSNRFKPSPDGMGLEYERCVTLKTIEPRSTS